MSKENTIFYNPESPVERKEYWLEVLNELDKEIEKDSKNEKKYFDRATVKLNLGKDKEAIEDYKMAIKLDSNNAESHNRIGLLYEKLDLHQEAIKNFSSAIGIDASKESFYSNRAVAKFRLNKYEDAISDYDTAIKLNPKVKGDYNERGVLKAKLNRHEEAIIDFDQAIRLDKNYFTPYVNRSMAKADLGQKEDAEKDILKAERLNPKTSLDYNSLGVAMSELGMSDKAFKYFSEAVKLDPTNEDASYNKNVVKKDQDAEKKLQEIKKQSNHFLQLREGFDDEVEGVKKKFSGYSELKDIFCRLSILYWIILVDIFAYTHLMHSVPLDFSPVTILISLPLFVFIHSYLKYRELEIKVNHKIKILEYKEVKLKDASTTDAVKFAEKDMESIIDNANKITFAEMSAKENTTFNFLNKQ